MEIGQKMRNAQSYVFVLESLNLLLECVDCKRYKECFGIFGGIDKHSPQAQRVEDLQIHFENHNYLAQYPLVA